MTLLTKKKITINKTWLKRNLKKDRTGYTLWLAEDEYQEIFGVRQRKLRSPRQKLDDLLDAMCSEYVRKRAMLRCGGCERCHHKKASYHGLQAAHYISRSKKILRWEVSNLCGLCPPCHIYIDGHPVEKLSFFYELLGKETIEKLDNMAKSTARIDRQAVKINLKRLLETV